MTIPNSDQPRFISAHHVASDGTITPLGKKPMRKKPEFWDDQSEQAARNKSLLNRITGEEK